MASQDTKTSRFEADFKQYQSEVTNYLDAFLKAFNDQITGLLLSDTVKNPKLNTNPTLSVRSHPVGDPQSSSNSFKSVNAIQTCFKSNNYDKKGRFQVNTLTVISLELGENGSEYIQSIAPEKMKDLGLFILSCRLGDSKPFDTLADLGSYVNLLSLKLFQELKVGLLEETNDVLGLAIELSHIPDAEANPFKDILVFRKIVEFLGAISISLKGNIWESEDLIENPIKWNRPPKEGDGAWHIRIELIDPDGEKFNRAFQSIPKNKRLSLKENPSDILNLDHFHDS
ncbi:hypothetical protein Tco_0791970 [Tanacetum coccineum]